MNVNQGKKKWGGGVMILYQLTNWLLLDWYKIFQSKQAKYICSKSFVNVYFRHLLKRFQKDSI